MTREFTSRHERQKLEHERWKDELSVAVISHIGIFVLHDDMELFANSMLLINKDEGGELMEVSAKKFLINHINEVLND